MDTKNQSVKSSHQCTSDCNNTKDCPVCPHGYDEENFCSECDETTERNFESPYRHIEEANEENYKAVEKSNEKEYDEN